MNKPIVITASLLLGLSSSALLAEESLKEGAKEVGRETGEVVRKVGEGGKQAGKKVAETAREVGHATRDGAKEFVKAVKGETTGNSSNASSASSTAPAGRKGG